MKKIIILIIAVIIVVLNISLVFIRKNNNKKDYELILTCSNTQNNIDYTMVMQNIYYFGKLNKVEKVQNSIIYIFDNKKSYDSYKNNNKEEKIEKIDGISNVYIFDDLNYVYENRITYDYLKLKKNKKVKIDDDILTLDMSNNDKIILYIEDYDSVILNNRNLGFECY